MSYFPLFIDIKGKKCIVIGAGKVALRKITTLINFEPEITVISPDICDELNNMDNIKIIKSGWDKNIEDIAKDAFLIIAATNDNSVNCEIYEFASKNNILVNIADSSGKCTFIFPSVVKRDDLVIGITSSGTFPTLSKRVRELIEKLLPKGFGENIDVLRGYRKTIINKVEPLKRREITNKVLDVIINNELSREEVLIEIEKIIGEGRNE